MGPVWRKPEMKQSRLVSLDLPQPQITLIKDVRLLLTATARANVAQKQQTFALTKLFSRRHVLPADSDCPSSACNAEKKCGDFYSAAALDRISPCYSAQSTRSTPAAANSILVNSAPFDSTLDDSAEEFLS